MYVFSCFSRRDVSYLYRHDSIAVLCLSGTEELIALHVLKRLVQLVGDITIYCSVKKKLSFLSYPILDSLVRITGDILLVVCIYRYFVPRLERSVWFAGKCTDGYFVYVKGGLLDSWSV